MEPTTVQGPAASASISSTSDLPGSHSSIQGELCSVDGPLGDLDFDEIQKLFEQSTEDEVCLYSHKDQHPHASSLQTSCMLCL